MKKITLVLIILTLSIINNHKITAQENPCTANGISSLWRKNLTKSHYTWAWNENTLDVKISDGMGGLLPSTSVAYVIRSAINFAIAKWTAAANLHGQLISLSEASDYNSADIKVYFENFENTAQYGSGDYINLKIHINNQHTWTDDYYETSYPDLYTLVVHEMGHIFLGPDHAGEFSSSVMDYDEDARKRDLTECDTYTTINFYDAVSTITVKNSFGEGNMKIDGTPTFVPENGLTINNWQAHTFPHTLEAVDQVIGRYSYTSKNNWTRQSDQTVLNGNSIQIQIGNNAYKANFNTAIGVTFKNSFAYTSEPGVVNSFGNQPAPYTVYLDVPSNESVGVSVPSQSFDGIQYDFVQWQDGNNLNPRIFNAGSDSIYTASFTTRPVHVTNVQSHYAVGNPIYITWDEHPDANVTQYRIIRKIKGPGRYSIPIAFVLTNLNQGTTYYYDNSFKYTDGYTDELLYYDVMAIDNNLDIEYSDTSYIATFGELNWNSNFGGNDQFVKLKEIIPDNYGLGQNYPNPFNPATQIKYSIKEGGFVTLNVYDELGRVVATLVNENTPAGIYTVNFDASKLSSGIYFYIIKTGSFFDRKKMILMK